MAMSLLRGTFRTMCTREKHSRERRALYSVRFEAYLGRPCVRRGHGTCAPFTALSRGPACSCHGNDGDAVVTTRTRQLVWNLTLEGRSRGAGACLMTTQPQLIWHRLLAFPTLPHSPPPGPSSPRCTYSTTVSSPLYNHSTSRSPVAFTHHGLHKTKSAILSPPAIQRTQHPRSHASRTLSEKTEHRPRDDTPRGLFRRAHPHHAPPYRPVALILTLEQPLLDT